jgi:hypothetical protein
MRALVLAALVACGGSSEDRPAAGPRARPDGAAIRIEPAAAFDAVAAAAKKPPDQPAALFALLLEHVGPLHRDCTAGSELTCVLFDQAYAGAASLAQRDRPAAIAILEKGCAAGDQVQCALAGEALDDPGGTSKETPQAIARLLEVCRRGMLHACERAAEIRIGSGLAVPELSEAAALEHVERACAAGLVDGCRVLVALAGAIPPPAEFAGSAQYQTRVRACRAGDASACGDILELIRPAPPFGCSLCDRKAAEDSQWKLASGEFDERCMDCEIWRCRKENCCPTCALRDKHACCADDGNPRQFPDRPPPADPAAWKAAARAARAGTGRGLALFKAGCARGMQSWCDLVRDLEGKLAALEHPPR